MENVPAYKEEPYMPPEDEVRRWAYARYRTYFSADFFLTTSMAFDRLIHEEVTKSSKTIKQKAEELTAGAPDDTAKLRKLYEFVQKNIKNTSFDSSVTDEEQEKLDIDNVGEVLKKGAGSAMWVDLLFASLASSSGFPVAVVLSGNRSENFFDPQKYPYASFIHPAAIAVRADNKWKIFNPGTPYLPFGRLVWYEENSQAMLVSAGYDWITIPPAEPAASLAKRTGKFNLLEDGTLEGTLTLEYTGHPSFTRRREGLNETPDKRQDAIKDDIKGRISSAEIGSVTVENFDDNTKPLTYTVNIKVPNYATKTGKRLFLQPGFFEYGNKPVFASSTRVNSISFPYSWSEADDLQIQLPAGFELDNADSPAGVTDQGKITGLKIAMRYDKAANLLIYRRNFFFGAGGT
jgi:Transglutaminase-like superfamily